MPLRFRTLTILLVLVPLAGCGRGDADRSTLAIESKLSMAVHCMGVHAAILQAGFGPLAVAENASETRDIVDGMRETADQLPLSDTGQPTLREAHRSLADQVESVSGRGVEAAAALAKSERYQADAAVLGTWYTAHCNREQAAPAQD